MKNVIKLNNLRPGDRVLVPKSLFGMIQHHATYIGRNHLGIDLMSENVIGIGVRIISADDFFKDVTSITEIVRLPGNDYDRRAAVNRAVSEVGKPYDLFNYNCESYSNYVQFKRKDSSQAETAKAILGFAALVFIATKLSN